MIQSVEVKKNYLLNHNNIYKACFSNKLYPVNRITQKTYRLFSSELEEGFIKRNHPYNDYIRDIKKEDISFGFHLIINALYRGVDYILYSSNVGENSVTLLSSEVISNESISFDRDSFLTKIKLDDHELELFPDSVRAYELPTFNEFKSLKELGVKAPQLIQFFRSSEALQNEVSKMDSSQLEKIIELNQTIQRILGNSISEKHNLKAE